MAEEYGAKVFYIQIAETGVVGHVTLNGLIGAQTRLVEYLSLRIDTAIAMGYDATFGVLWKTAQEIEERVVYIVTSEFRRGILSKESVRDLLFLHPLVIHSRTSKVNDKLILKQVPIQQPKLIDIQMQSVQRQEVGFN